MVRGTVVVTGGAGFIGSNLVRALNERGETDILVVDRLDDAGKRRNLEPLRFREYRDKQEFRDLVRADRVSGVRCVFHMGACSSTTETDEAYLHDNNYRYTRELCEWCLGKGARFVYASSAATYGSGTQGYSDADEATPSLKPLNAYGRSKQQFDLWALETGALRRIVGLKYFNVYGPGEDHKGHMRSLVNKVYPEAACGGPVALFRSHRPDYGDGEQRRDFVHVSDAVSVTLFFGDRTEVSGLFNCGTGEARTWKELASALFAALGMPVRIEWIDMPDGIREQYQYCTRADIGKLRSAGYAAPFLPIEEGVRRYVHEYLVRQPIA